MKAVMDFSKPLAALDKLPQRDRWTLAVGVLALALGVQSLVVSSARERRLAIESSSVADRAERSESETQALADKTRERDALKTRQALTAQQLAELGLASTPHDAIGALISRALPGNSVQLIGLQALPTQELSAPTEDNPNAVAEAASTAPPAPMLFRHRAEFRLEGPVAPLLQALDAVEHRLAPLHIEQVRLTAVPGGAQARVTLTTLSRDRNWLAL